MANKVEITITAKNNTKAGFAAARAEATKAGQEVADAYDRAVTTGTRRTGTKVARQVSDDVVKGVKGTGRKVAEDIDSETVRGTRDTGKKVAKQIADEAAKAKPGELIGKETALGFRNAFAGNSGGNDLLSGVFKGTGGLAGAAGGSAGLAIGAAVIGGLSTALVGGGVVGLGGFLLKDNAAVKKAWGETFKEIGEDAKRRAGFLEDEYVAGAEATAQAWETKLGPALERIFINAQPLVDDFIAMPTNWLDALAPGVEKAVKNAGPAVEGLNNMGTAIFKGLGDGLADLSEHSADAKVAMELIGEGVGATLEGALGFIGDLSEKVADNEEAWRSWGRGIGNVAGAVGTDIKNLTDLAAAASSPDGKNSEGDSIGKALEKLLMGDDFKEPVRGDYNDVRNLGSLGERVGRTFERASDAITNPTTMVSETKAVDGSVLDSQLKLLAARRDLNEATEKANYLDSIGLTNSQGRIEAGLAISQSQAQLIESGAALTEVTGNNTVANERYIEAINTMTAAGLPASDALLSMVSGMNSTELAAMNATVRTDELGNSVISIPGQKDITVNAATIPAQNAIYAVQSAVNSLTGKTVYIDVITRGVSAAASAVAGFAAAAAAAVPRNKGGIIPGGGPDVDSRLVAATPGEFVVNRKATNANLPLLEAINKGAGGDTVMQMAGGSGRASSSAAPAAGGAGPTIVQLNVQPGRLSGMDRMFLSFIAEALQTTGGMAVNGWKP